MHKCYEFRNKYKVSDEDIKRPNNGIKHSEIKERNKIKRRITGIALGVMGTMVAGTVFIGARQIIKDKKAIIKNPKIAVEQGYTLEDMDIDEQTLAEIEVLEERIQNFDDISNSELPEIINKLHELQFKVLKTKVSNTVDKPIEDIKIYYSTNPNDPNRLVVGDDIYLEKMTILDGSENSISKNINRYINSTRNIYDFNEKNWEKSNIDRESIEKECQKALKSINEITTTDFQITQKGELIAQKLKIQNKKETKKIAEIEDEER